MDLIERWHLDKPFWRFSTVYGESLFFLKHGRAAPEAPLLFAPEAVEALTSATGAEAYQAGTDYELCAAERKIRLRPGSRIPWLDAAELQRKPGDPLSIGHKADDPQTHLYFSEGCHFHNRQAMITYRHSEQWGGFRPAPQGAALPKTSARLKAKQPLSIFIIGDSITEGANASKKTGVRPFQPPYPELFAEALAQATGCPVTARNYAVGGRTAEHGVTLIPEIIARQPDLLVIAYGMNDAAADDSAPFEQRIRLIVTSVQNDCPDAEFLLVAPMRGNPLWKHTCAERFAPLRDALASLCGRGTVLADMTALWDDLLRRKTFYDITGNGVNHPNDFGHRLYAQVLLETLLPGPTCKQGG